MVKEKDSFRRPARIMYVVDELGFGTHRSVEEALHEAEKHPHQRVMITIHPHTTIENFVIEDGHTGDDV